MPLYDCLNKPGVFFTVGYNLRRWTEDETEDDFRAAVRLLCRLKLARALFLELESGAFVIANTERVTPEDFRKGFDKLRKERREGFGGWWEAWNFLLRAAAAWRNDDYENYLNENRRVVEATE